MTTATDTDTRPYSPGLEGVVGAESAIGLVDGANGRLLYRGYPITQLVDRGSYAEVADLLWTGEWHPGATLPPEPVPAPVLALRELPRTAAPMDALRTAVSVWGATQELAWPPTPEQARALTAFSPSALAAFGRRRGLEPVEPDRSLGLAAAFLQQLNAETPDPGSAGPGRVLHRGRGARTERVDVHRTGHHLDPLGHRVGGDRRDRRPQGPAPWRRPSEVVDQLHQIRSRQRRALGPRRDRPRRADHGLRAPRVPRLRPAGRCTPRGRRRHGLHGRLARHRGQGRGRRAARACRLKPGRVIKTNVEYYAAAVLQGVGLAPELFPATFALARHAGWTAHSIEQASANKLIRPDMRYTGRESATCPPEVASATFRPRGRQTW